MADLTTGRNGVTPEVACHRIGARGTLLVVSDGMGGAAAGEVASSMAVQAIYDEMMRGFDPGVTVADALRIASDRANKLIWERSQGDASVRGLGATLTAAFVLETSLFVAQVGDSRAYLLRGEHIYQITEDQSWANAIRKAGIDARDVPSNVILQALGTQPSLNAEVTGAALCREDVLLLCSDGLSNKVTDEDMRSIIRMSPELTAACQTLVNLANERGGEDNITVVLARFDGNGLPDRDSMRSPVTDRSSTEMLVQPAVLEPGATRSALGTDSRQPPAALPSLPVPIPPGSVPGASLSRAAQPKKKQTLAVAAISAFLVLGGGVALLVAAVVWKGQRSATPPPPAAGQRTPEVLSGVAAPVQGIPDALSTVADVLVQVDAAIERTKQSPRHAEQHRQCVAFAEELEKYRTELESFARSTTPMDDQIRMARERKQRALEIAEKLKQLVPETEGPARGDASRRRPESLSNEAEGIIQPIENGFRQGVDTLKKNVPIRDKPNKNDDGDDPDQ